MVGTQKTKDLIHREAWFHPTSEFGMYRGNQKPQNQLQWDCQWHLQSDGGRAASESRRIDRRPTKAFKRSRGSTEGSFVWRGTPKKWQKSFKGVHLHHLVCLCNKPPSVTRIITTRFVCLMWTFQKYWGLSEEFKERRDHGVHLGISGPHKHS